MRLKSLWIDGFKNLNDFKIDFKKREGVTVLIGNNASGKSNVLEAISAIFAGIYNSKLDKLSFKFDLVYTINNLDIRVSKKQKARYRVKKIGNASWNNIEKLSSLDSVAGKMKAGERLSKRYNYKPSQVIALYSGEESRLWEDYYQKSYFDFNATSLRNDVYLSKLNMLYINKYYWDIALLTMYASDVDGLTEIVKSELKETTTQVNTKLWRDFIQEKPNNEVNNFIGNFMQPELDGDGLENIHSFNLSLDEFKNRVDLRTHTELFNLFCVARLPKDEKSKLITDLELKFENGRTTKDFSEGQKKQILLKLCLEVLADKNSLFLFDEPDAHIHIINKKLIPEMLKNENKEAVLTTHSPTLAHQFDNKHLAYIEDGKINEGYNTQEKLLSELTGGLMGVSEQQLFLQSNKDILIVEGKTDEAYITQALKILKEDNEEYQNLDFNFLWLGGTDADTLNKIILEFKPKESQTIIAFFDRDSSGKKCIEKILDNTELSDDFEGEKKEGIYIYLYPKKDSFTNENFVVEDYFPIETLKNFVYAECKTYQVLNTKFNKVKFSQKCKEDNFEKSNFDGFKTLFDKIIEIKNQS